MFCYKDHAGGVFCLESVFRNDQLHIISGSSDKTIKVWNASNGNNLTEYIGHENTVRCLSQVYYKSMELLSEDYFASGGAEGKVMVWSFNQELKKTLSGHYSEITSIVPFSLDYDHSLLISGSKDGTIKLWDIVREACLRTLVGHQSWVWTLGIVRLNYKLYLYSGGLDQQLLLWELKDTNLDKEEKLGGEVPFKGNKPMLLRRYS